jgi:uncharacterized protein (DUF1015 family)
VKKQGELAELLSPEPVNSIESKKNSKSKTRNPVRISQVHIDTEFPKVNIEPEEDEVRMSIKTIEKTYRNMPKTLKKKLRQKLSLKNGLVQTDETTGIDVI